MSIFAGAQASHLDNVNGVFDSYKWDHVKFKTQTNCQLDTYPEVSFVSCFLVRSVISWITREHNSQRPQSLLLLKDYPESSSITKES